ncbi:MAG TPA: YqgE/AlgH family protein, partial [Planctomycetaceae bacterium]|nr:YqgE/AlgH family protein [Planctomycetaceae bacterium]
MADSLRGQFLIAGRGLRDPNFFQTVVLIVGHGAEGAMGVVVNRPSGLTVAEA